MDGSLFSMYEAILHNAVRKLPPEVQECGSDSF